MTPGWMLSRTMRHMAPKARLRRLAAARRHLEPFDHEATASLALRAFNERLRMETFLAVLEHGEEEAERLLGPKWRGDRAAVRRGEHPLGLAHVATAQQAIALGTRRPVRLSRATRGRREARSVGHRTTTRARAPTSSADADGDDAAAESTPARSHHRQAKGPSRIDAARTEARHA